MSYFVKNFFLIKFNYLLLECRFLRFKPYLYIFFHKRPLFYLDFNRFRFKKIKKFRIIRKLFFKKKMNSSKILKRIVFLKKNVNNLFLKKTFPKKSLYNNRYFNARFFFQRLKKKFIRRKYKKFNKRGAYSLKKFFMNYIRLEREFFLKMFGLKNKKQKTTTRFASKLTKYNPINFQKSIELSILNMLIRCRFSLSKNYAQMLISSKVVYINFNLVIRSSTLLKKNDLLQVVFIKSFFYLYKYAYNLVFKRISKLNYCVWRIQSSKKRKNKQHIRTFPSWLNSIFFFPYSIPRYIEVDFTCLSACLLRNPSAQVEFSPHLYWNFNYYFYKLMVWKWIT